MLRGMHKDHLRELTRLCLVQTLSLYLPMGLLEYLQHLAQVSKAVAPHWNS